MAKETISQTEGLCKEITTCVRNAYDRGDKQGEKDGYEYGYRDGQNIEQSNAVTTKEEVAKMEYERGLNAAWECARKLILSESYGGLELCEIEKIFGDGNYPRIIRTFSASGCLAKNKEYEKQKQVTRQTIIKSQLLDIINGQKNPVTADEIVEVLEQMKEIKNDV